MGWDGEGDLDIDAVSAVCPACHILFVESRSDGTDDLMTAVATAVALGASEVSLSWGGSEDPGQTVYDATLDHPGVAITAATGDDGFAAGASYPATSPYVTAVGGTTLSPASGGAWTETAWSGSMRQVCQRWRTGTSARASGRGHAWCGRVPGAPVPGRHGARAADDGGRAWVGGAARAGGRHRHRRCPMRPQAPA